MKYHPNGAISSFTYGNGVAHAMSQNLRQLPQVVSDVGVAGYTYSYDANGNPTRIDDNAQGTSFNRYLDYDGLDRLTRASSAMFGGSLHRIDYAYDPLDNLRAVTHAGVREHSYWYNGKNQLTNVLNTAGASVVGLDYDPQGNLRQKNGQTYGFDHGNRLRWVVGEENYRYDSEETEETGSGSLIARSGFCTADVLSGLRRSAGALRDAVLTGDAGLRPPPRAPRRAATAGAGR